MSTVKLNTDKQGYLQDFSEWDESVAEEIAEELDIKLSEKHWEVIKFIQAESEKGIEHTVRSMGQSGVVTIAELYQLFPGGPLKYVYKIAGLPRPRNCV